MMFRFINVFLVTGPVCSEQHNCTGHQAEGRSNRAALYRVVVVCVCVCTHVDRGAGRGDADSKIMSIRFAVREARDSCNLL
jgi:hypothetical protein